MSSKSRNIPLMTKANPFFVSLSGEEKYEWGNKEFARDPSEVDHAGAGGHDSAKVPAQKKKGAKKKGKKSQPDPAEAADGLSKWLNDQLGPAKVSSCYAMGSYQLPQYFKRKKYQCRRAERIGKRRLC